jgi:energy-coupling factor transporter ATP-binding protein EcfA2
MLTRLRVRNFKTLEDIDIPLGQNVVLIGPNNSGKTSALQALALWRSGFEEWTARRPDGASQAKQRVGVTLNRRALTHTPVPQAKALWRDLRVTIAHRENSAHTTQHVYLDIVVDGETGGAPWSCGFEFQHANSESIYCRPLRLNGADERMSVPREANHALVALLPPMSGLSSEEPELQRGRVSVLIGEGQTAQVLRNLCFQVFVRSADDWRSIAAQLKLMFGVDLGVPARHAARGSIELTYTERGVVFDLSSAGRGMQQTLLLLAHIYANPGSTLLLDEPDAHLEILRQRQIYALITDTARRMGSQIIAASHSEVLLNEAADRDVVVAFVGKPHRIDDRGSQVLKSLKEIGFDQYYQAEQTGFVIYLEGSTDLAILRAFARKLAHPAQSLLDAPFVHYVLNQPPQALHHFYGLREAKPDLKGFAVFDRLERGVPSGFALPCVEWRRREIENYLCSREILLRYAEGMEPDDLIGRALRAERREKMVSAIAKIEGALKTLGKDPWSPDAKVSDEFFKPLFETYFASLGGDNRLNKSNYHELAEFIEPGEIDGDVIECLDKLVAAAP